MPSSQMQVSNQPSANAASLGCRPPPPPNKLPPPPPQSPPPPLPKPPPPPPPRNSSQLLCQSSAQLAGQGCGSVNIPQNVNGILNSGSSMSSLNSAGRCGHSQSIVPGSIPSQHCQRNLIKFNDNCSSRSSISSHSSLQHHHHANINHAVPNLPPNGPNGLSNLCSHQASNGCPCQTNSAQHNHINSSSMSDNGSCTYGLDNRAMSSSSCGGCCGNNSVHHVHNSNSKCQQSQNMHNMTANLNRGNTTIGNPATTTITRNNLFHSNESTNPSLLGANSDARVHCQGSCTHHHHHHGLHGNQTTTNPGMSTLQPVDGSFHRCHTAQANTIASLPSLMSDQIQRPSMNGHCNHTHRSTICNHHHQATNFCDHHVHPNNQQQTPHQFNACSRSHHGCASPNMMMGKGYTASCNTSRHCPQSSNHANRSSDMSNNDSLLSTTHTHNLSNSSTTTHTSNMAVKHQPQSFVHPAPSRGNRSNSSQHYDQYGQSSAASTSSATASLSNYQMQAGSEDLIPFYPPNKINQPLPPTPSRMPTSNLSNNNSNNNNNMNFNGNMNSTNINNIPMMTTTLINTPQGPQPMHPLPPLPPKPHSPNASSCSTQITTLTTSPSLLNQPITRVTSQAGVQNPLPERNTPPPLPPLNSSSRPQPATNSQAKLQQPPVIPNQQLINLSANLDGLHVTEAERKIDALTHQVEQELERMKKSGDLLGVCFKCGEKVTRSQEACEAMNKIYHASCFVCCMCNRSLFEKSFYPVMDKVYCEEDFKYTGHMQSLEKCAACSQPIIDMILTTPTMKKSFHPKCFKCCICGQCLDGVPFTIDLKDKIYCVKDYHRIYSPKCAACGKSITPIDETGETVRVVSMEKDYHIDCYCCEDCGLQLTDEEPSQSYPLDNHLLCRRCHINRLSKMQAALTIA